MSKLMKAARKKRPDAVELLENDPLRVQIARQLRTARKDAGLTQAQLSAESGISQPVLSGMESPTGPMPEIYSMDRFMKACGKKLWLSFETDDEPVEVKHPQVVSKPVTRRMIAGVHRVARQKGKLWQVVEAYKGAKAQKRGQVTVALHPTKELIVQGSPRFAKVGVSGREYAVIGDEAKDQKGAGLFVGTASVISQIYSKPTVVLKTPSRPTSGAKKH
ncbi:helix-turn-helix domain-containing protein [Roseovarius sp. SYSU LYC5161]|uniref:helix-turn-helix domain-containing protein n=1 Tax=Roseovarius halophilus (ex Wu et al. 2025) TaxID=3376060 RepID=UPI0039997CAB